MNLHPLYLQPGDPVRFEVNYYDPEMVEIFIATKGSLGIAVSPDAYFAQRKKRIALYERHTAYQDGLAARIALHQKAVEDGTLYPIRLEEVKPPEDEVLRQYGGRVYGEKGSVEIIYTHALAKLFHLDQRTVFCVDQYRFVDTHGPWQAEWGYKLLVVEIRLDNLDGLRVDRLEPPRVTLTHRSGLAFSAKALRYEPAQLESPSGGRSSTVEATFQVPDSDGPYHCQVEVPAVGHGEATLNRLRLQTGDRVGQVTTLGTPKHTGTIISAEVFVVETERRDAADKSREMLYRVRNYPELISQVQSGIDQGVRYAVRLDSGDITLLLVDMLEKID